MIKIFKFKPEISRGWGLWKISSIGLGLSEKIFPTPKDFTLARGIEGFYKMLSHQRQFNV